MKTIEENRKFLEAWAGLLQGSGLVLLLLGLSCKLISWGYCSMQIVPLFGRDPRIPDDISLINIPLAMLVLGMGIRVKSPYGWWIVTVLLSVLFALFSFLSWIHWQSWPIRETRLDQWELVPFLQHPDADALITTAWVSLLILSVFCYWLSNPVRYWYFSKPDSSPSGPSDNASI